MQTLECGQCVHVPPLPEGAQRPLQGTSTTTCRNPRPLRHWHRQRHMPTMPRYSHSAQQAQVLCCHADDSHACGPQPHPAILGSDSPFVCDKCQTRCKTALALKQHQGSSKCNSPPPSPLPYTCHICNTSYKDAKGLKRHNKKQHPHNPTDLPMQTNTLHKYLTPSKPPPAKIKQPSSHITTITDLTYIAHSILTHHGQLLTNILHHIHASTTLTAQLQSLLNIPPSTSWLSTTAPPADTLTLSTTDHCFHNLIQYVTHHPGKKHPPPATIWLKHRTCQQIRRLLGHGISLRGRDGRSSHSLRTELPNLLSTHSRSSTWTTPTTSPSHSTLGASSRTDLAGDHPRHRPYDVHLHRDGIHSPIIGRSSTHMASELSTAQGHPLLEDDTHAGHAARIPPTPTQGELSSTTGRIEGQAHPTGLHQRSNLDLFAVGPIHQTEQTHSRDSSKLPGGGTYSGQDAESHRTHRPEPIPGPSFTEPNLFGSDPMENFHLPEKPSGYGIPQTSHDTHQILSHPNHHDAAQGSQHSELPHGISGAQTPSGNQWQHHEGQGQGQRQTSISHDVLSRLRHLAFSNDGNWCWLNSIFLSYGITLMEWIEEFPDGASVPWVYEQLLKQPPLPLMHIRELVSVSAFETSLPNPWVEQQDSGEAIHCWLQILGCSCTDMGWHFRRDTSLLDTGGFQVPISLTIPPGRKRKVRLQTLIKHWHKDARGSMAMVKPAPIVCLKIGRFHSSAHRRQDLVTWDYNTFQLPVFSGDDESINWYYYKIRAGLLHYGSTPASGHYQAFGITVDDDYLIWDDDRPPYQSMDHPLIFQHVEIVWATLACSKRHGHSDAQSLHSIPSDYECLNLDPADCHYAAESLQLQAKKRMMARRHRQLTRQRTLGSHAPLGQLLASSFGHQ